MLRKLAKPNPATHCPIALLNTMAKVLLACVVEDLVQMAKAHSLLPSNHFGCHPSRMTSDSLHYVTTFVKNAWRRKEVMSMLFLDIKSTFLNVMLMHLIHDMHTSGVPLQYTIWIEHKVSSCHTILRFDSYELEPLAHTMAANLPARSEGASSH